MPLDLRDREIIRRIGSIRASDVFPNKMRNQIRPVSEDETLRRGLHSSRFLFGIDEKILLELLSKYLHSALRMTSKENIGIAKDLSLATYAAMIVKYGILKAEPFENIPTALEFLYCTHYQKRRPGNSKKTDQNLHKIICNLSATVDSVFLKTSFS